MFYTALDIASNFGHVSYIRSLVFAYPPCLLVAKSRCEQSEAKKQKFSCLNCLNLFVLSSVENFFVSACSCELVKYFFVVINFNLLARLVCLVCINLNYIVIYHENFVLILSKLIKKIYFVKICKNIFLKLLIFKICKYTIC